MLELKVFDHIERAEKSCTYWKKSASFTYYANPNTEDLNKDADNWAARIAQRVYCKEVDELRQVY